MPDSILLLEDWIFSKKIKLHKWHLRNLGKFKEENFWIKFPYLHNGCLNGQAMESKIWFKKLRRMFMRDWK